MERSAVVEWPRTGVASVRGRIAHGLGDRIGRHQVIVMTAADAVPERQIRALFTPRTVTVYQAYAPEIADRALAAGTFVPPFRLGRMTWIKPSFPPGLKWCGWSLPYVS